MPKICKNEQICLGDVNNVLKIIYSFAEFVVSLHNDNFIRKYVLDIEVILEKMF